MVQVVRADVVPQVRGTVGHAEGRGAEEAGAEGACVGGREVSRLGVEEGGGRWWCFSCTFHVSMMVSRTCRNILIGVHAKLKGKKRFGLG